MNVDRPNLQSTDLPSFSPQKRLDHAIALSLVTSSNTYCSSNSASFSVEGKAFCCLPNEDPSKLLVDSDGGVGFALSTQCQHGPSTSAKKAGGLVLPSVPVNISAACACLAVRRSFFSVSQRVLIVDGASSAYRWMPSATRSKPGAFSFSNLHICEWSAWMTARSTS